jgi:hypothetical protein
MNWEVRHGHLTPVPLPKFPPRARTLTILQAVRTRRRSCFN